MSPQIEVWLRSTIPGLIVLGAVGSIVGYLALKALSKLFRKLGFAALDRFMAFNFRPFTSSAILCHRFANTGRGDHLVVYAVGSLVALNAWFVIFATCLIATVVVAVHIGVSAPGLLGTLFAATGLAGIILVRQGMSAAGIAAVLFYRDIKEVTAAMKDSKFVFSATARMMKDLEAKAEAAASEDQKSIKQETGNPPAAKREA